MNLTPRTGFVWMVAWGFLPLARHLPTLVDGEHVAGPKKEVYEVSTVPLVRYPSVDRERHRILEAHFKRLGAELSAPMIHKLETFHTDEKTRNFLENWSWH